MSRNKAQKWSQLGPCNNAWQSTTSFVLTHIIEKHDLKKRPNNVMEGYQPVKDGAKRSETQKPQREFFRSPKSFCIQEF